MKGKSLCPHIMELLLDSSFLLFMCSWLFIGDLSREGIYKISLDDKEEVKVVTSMCPNNLAMDYSNGNLFWVDSCTYQLGTSKIDGSQDHIVQTGSNSFFSYGASVYDTHVFWIEAGETSSVDCFEMVTSEQHRVYTTTGTITRDIQIVHSSNQPSRKSCDALMSEDRVTHCFFPSSCSGDIGAVGDMSGELC